MKSAGFWLVALVTALRHLSSLLQEIPLTSERPELSFEILQVNCAGYHAEPPWNGDPSCIRSTTGPTVQPRVCRAERPRSLALVSLSFM